MKKLKKQLKSIMNKNCKMHYKTLNKINNQLNKNNCIDVINYHYKLNINIVELGKENLIDVLTDQEQKEILKRKYKSIETLVSHVHFNHKYPQFHNIIITNINNNIAYRYDGNSKQFKAIEKNKLLEDIIDCRSIDIETFYDEHKHTMKDNDKKVLEQFIKQIEHNTALQHQKKKNIKIIAYNNLKTIFNKYNQKRIKS